MKLFKRKQNKTKEMDWYDITLGQFIGLKGLDLNDISDQITATEILLGIDADEFTIKEYAALASKLEFMNTPMPKVIIRSRYELNGTTYRCDSRLDTLSVSQYMDFTNLAKTNDIVKILGVFLVPDGCKYGDYDIEKVYDDIKTMSVVDAYAIFNFFLLEFNSSIKVIQDCSMKMMKKGMTKNQIEDIRKALELVDMESYFM